MSNVKKNFGYQIVYQMLISIIPFITSPYISSNLSLWFFKPKDICIERSAWKDIIYHIKPMLTLFFAVIATSMFSYMDRIMLGEMS